MNEAKESQVSDGSGESAAPEGVNPASGRRDGGEGRDHGEPALTERPGNLPQPAGVMNVVLKRTLIAAALFAACVGILAAVKAYGVWVLSGIAVVLFGLGLLRKDKKPAGSGDGRDASGDGERAMKPVASPLDAIIPAVTLPEGYSGKIMLISIAIGEESLVVLRAGGKWHREILRNTEAEICALGLSEVQMDERGGAYLRFEADGSIFLWGRSDEFGTCDYGRAAALLKSVWPNRKVAGPFGEMP